MNDLVTSTANESSQVPNPAVEDAPQTRIEGGMPVNDPNPQPQPQPEVPQEPENAAQDLPQDNADETPPEPNQAAQDRLRQQQARNNKLLASLGIDPMSDLAEQLEDGIITPEMLKQHVASQWGLNQPRGPEQQAAPTPQTPLDQAQARYQSAKEAYKAEVNEGGVSLETNTEYLEAMEALHEAKLNDVRGQVTARQQQEQADQNLNAILSDVRSGEHYQQMEPELQSGVEMVSVALTGMIADREARRLGYDPTTLSPQQVAGFARRANEQLNSLANYYIKVGENNVRNGIRPTTQQQPAAMPVPANAGGNPAPTVNPYATVNVSNHQAMAKQFAQNQRRL